MYELEGKLVKENRLVSYQLKTPLDGKKIRYTSNGIAATNDSKLYTGSVLITKNTTINAGVFKNNQLVSNPFAETINYHKAITGKVDLNVLPHKAYNAGGKEALINGIQGSDQRYGDKEWLGFWGDDVKITIDLGEIKTINTLKTRFYNATGQWIYAPKKISVSCLIDGKIQIVYSKLLDSKSEKNIIAFEIDLSDLKEIQAQVIILTIPSYGIIQEGKQGAGNKAWTFIDEIIIE